MTFKVAAKAWLAAAGALGAYLLGVLDPDALGMGAFATVTTSQWVGAAVAVLGTFGITYAVPNAKGAHEL